MDQSSGSQGAGERAAVCAVVSTDAEFISGLRTSPPFEDGDYRLALEVPVAYPDITDAHLEELRSAAPDVVVLDLESDLSIGIKFAEFLSDAGIGRVLVGAANQQAPDILMEMMHAGISDFIPKPFTPEEAQKALRSARRRLGKAIDDRKERAPGQIFVFFSAKGGSGCTTVCTNTGIEVYRATRQKTLLLDLDLELGETALQLGEEPQFNMVDLVRNFHRVDSDLLASYIEHHRSGVDLLSAPYQPAGFEAMSGNRVAKILTFLRGQYDHVFVDAPRAMNPATVAAIQAADHLMLVTTPDLPSIRNLTRCLPLLKEIGGARAADWIRLVVNRYDRRGLISLKQIEETTGYPVYATIRNDYRTVMNAINENTPAVTMGRSEFSEDVRTLAGMLAGIDVESSPGLLGRLASSLRKTGGRKRAQRAEAGADA
jgi:pilus assembly protein CpaE